MNQNQDNEIVRMEEGSVGQYSELLQAQPRLLHSRRMSDYNGAATESITSIRHYIRILIQRKKIAILVFILIFGLVCTYTFSLTPIYRSTAVLEIQFKKARPNEITYDDSSGEDFARVLATKVGTLKSRALIGTLVAQLQLDEIPEFSSPNSGLVNSIKKMFEKILAKIDPRFTPEPVELPQHVKEHQVIKGIADRISVFQLMKSNLLEVGFDSHDPALAQLVLKAYLDTFLTRNLERRRNENVEALIWLKQELVRAEEKLIESEKALVEFMAKNEVTIGPDGGLGLVLDTVKKKGENLLKTQESKAKFQALSEHKDLVGTGLASERVDDELIKKLKAQLAELEAAKAELSSVYSEGSPKITMLAKKIKFLKDKIAQVQQEAVSSALNVSKREELLLRSAVDDAKQEALKVSSLGAQYAILKREVDTNRELHQIVLQEYKETNIRSRTIQNNMSIVDPPSMPVSPVWPRTGLFLITGFFVGCLGAAAAAFISYALDDTIQSTESMEKEYELVRLGNVPDMSNSSKLHYFRLRKSSYEFLAHDYPKSPFSDSIRNIYSSIMLSAPYGRVKSLAISSASSGEGKTLITIALGTVATANNTNRVLLVDCDLRKPKFHKLFNEDPNGPGLSTLLSGDKVSLEQTIHGHRIPGLFYITSGPLPQDHVSLLMSRRLGQLMDQLKKDFDLIILDCPPILGFPDARILSRVADGMVLVARQGHVSLEEFRSAADSIITVDGARILGIILNMTRSYGTGYGYSRHNSYLKRYYSSDGS